MTSIKNFRTIKNSLISLLILVSFQNCSEVGFGSKENNPVDNQCEGAACDPIVVCPNGEAAINGVCEPTVFTECKQYVELDTTKNPIVIPAMSSSGLCFYKKIFNAVANHTSGSFGEARATDVWANDHTSLDADGKRPFAKANPFVVGDVDYNFIFKDDREVSLASNSSADIALSKLFIDNFFLVEQTAPGFPKKLLARGTADSEPWATTIKGSRSDILVGSQPVTDFISYASGGTAIVDYIDVSDGFNVDIPTNLRVRLLDCGSSARASDVYLIIH